MLLMFCKLEKKKYILFQNITQIMENKWFFKIKTGYYLEILRPETIKLLGCTKSKITKVKSN